MSNDESCGCGVLMTWPRRCFLEHEDECNDGNGKNNQSDIGS